jgi:hypothetical protein
VTSSSNQSQSVAIKKAPGSKIAPMATTRAERAPCVCVCACSQHLQQEADAQLAAALAASLALSGPVPPPPPPSLAARVKQWADGLEAPAAGSRHFVPQGFEVTLDVPQATPRPPHPEAGATNTMGASVAQTQRPVNADYLHYFAEWGSQRLEGEASASVLQLPHGVELRSSSRSRGGPLRADMFRVKLIPSDHRFATGALSEVVHIIAHTATAAAGTAAGPATDGGDVPYPLLLRMPHRASAEQLEQLAFYRAETPDSEMQLVEGGCFWSDGYAEVEVTSFSVWMVALMKAAAVGWAVSTRTYIDRPVGVAAFAPTDPEAPRWLRFVLHPKQDPPPDNHFFGFCKVGDYKEVAVRRGKAVKITLKDHLPELFVTFAPWRNTRQSEIMPRVLELGPSSSHSSLLMAVISQPGVVPHKRPFPLMLPTAAAAVPEASRVSSAQSSSSPSRASSAQSSFYPSRASSAHFAQLMMSMPLPDTWDAEAGADVEQPRLVEVPSLVGAAPNQEFEHVASLLVKGLPGASIMELPVSGNKSELIARIIWRGSSEVVRGTQRPSEVIISTPWQSEGKGTQDGRDGHIAC